MKSPSSNIRLSCADFTFPLLSHDRSLDLIRDLGFEGVDIGFFEGRSHIQPSSSFENLKASAAALKELCSERNLKLADLFLIPCNEMSVLTVNHPDAAERQKSRDIFERSLEFAVECGAEHFSILPGVPWEVEELSASLDRAISELAWRAGLCTQAGLPLSCEAHLGSVVASPSDAVKLFESVPDLGLVLDCAHFIVPGYSQDEIEKLIPHTVHVHARGACKDQIQVVAAENTIDFERLVEALKGRDYSGWICSEYVWMQTWNCDRVDNLSETILMRQRLVEALKPSAE